MVTTKLVVAIYFLEKFIKKCYFWKEILNGDNEAFNLIVKRYRKQVISFIFKYCKNYEIKAVVTNKKE